MESLDGMTPQGGVVNGISRDGGGVSSGPSPSRRLDPHGVGDDSVRTEQDVFNVFLDQSCNRFHATFVCIYT